MRALAATIVTATLVLAGCDTAGGAPNPSTTPAAPSTSGAPNSRLVTTIRDPRITESSGLALSVAHPGIVYTHNDSGDSARFFAVDLRTGRTQAVYSLADQPKVHDVEDIAPGPDNRIWLGDIGSNAALRDIVSVYVITEPATLTDQQVDWTRYQFRYADGQGHNAEALLVRPTDGRLFVVTKEKVGTIYQAPATLSSGATNVLTKVGTAPGLVTAGDFQPGSNRFALRSNKTGLIYVYRELGDTAPATVPSPLMSQPESLTWTADGKAVLVGSEGANSPIYQVSVPG